MKNNSTDQTKQDEYFKSNIINMIHFARNRNSPKFSAFLDERQQIIAQEILNASKYSNYKFFGGLENCDRVILGVFPERQPMQNDAFPITSLKLTYSDKNEISHRDCLGSLMGLQIKRESIGDIVVLDTCSILFADNDIADFICLNLDKVGRANVKVTIADGVEIEKKQEYQEITGTVSSLRLDCIIALLLNKSRTVATQTIQANLVKVNYQDEQNVSKQISEGDVITIRGKGKFIVEGPIKKTKKDRCFITINKLL
ncbi:MAG: YlmH/Sll1252 family protein [Oscillospiraceae bacterium]